MKKAEFAIGILAIGLSVVAAGGGPLVAQQAKSKSVAPRAPAAEAKTKPKTSIATDGKAGPAQPKPAGGAKEAGGTADSPEKTALLNSPRWRRAMFEMNEWLSAQPFYDKKQVEDLKARLAEHVAEASASDLQFMLDDMEAKFQIIDSQPAQEARAWIAHYLSVITDKKRAEILRDMPNLATMTAAQLQQEVLKINRKRASRGRSQAAFDQASQAQVDAQLKRNLAAQQAYTQQSRSAATYTSPYRTPATENGKPPFSDYKPGPQMEYYIGAFGRFGLIYNPSSY